MAGRRLEAIPSEHRPSAGAGRQAMAPSAGSIGLLPGRRRRLLLVDRIVLGMLRFAGFAGISIAQDVGHLLKFCSIFKR